MSPVEKWPTHFAGALEWVFFCFSFFFFLLPSFSSSVSSSFAGTTRAFLTTSVKSRQARVTPNKYKERANMKDLLLRSSSSFRFTALRHDSRARGGLFQMKMVE